MPLFPYPSTAEVQDETKLRPEQVRTTFTTELYAADAAKRIVQEAAYVESKLTSRFSADVLADMAANDLVMAETVVELRAAASLYHSAGQLNAKYKDEAMDYERRAGEYLAALLDNVAAYQTPLDEIVSSSFSVRPTRIDGYARGLCPEYSDCRCP